MAPKDSEVLALRMESEPSPSKDEDNSTTAESSDGVHPESKSIMSSSPFTVCFDFSLVDCCNFGSKGICPHCLQPVTYKQESVNLDFTESSYAHADCYQEKREYDNATKIQTAARGMLARNLHADLKRQKAEEEARQREEENRRAEEEARRAAEVAEVEAKKTLEEAGKNADEDTKSEGSRGSFFKRSVKNSSESSKSKKGFFKKLKSKFKKGKKKGTEKENQEPAEL